RLEVTNGGTIPDRGLFGVFLAGGQRDKTGRHSRRVGELDEEMVYESRVGDVFVLGANLVRYLAGQREATGYVPDDRTLVMERFRDELGDWRLVLHSPFGARVHAPWALAIAARLRARYGGMDVQALHTHGGIVIRVPDADEPPPAGIALLDPDEIEQLGTDELRASAPPP